MERPFILVPFLEPDLQEKHALRVVLDLNPYAMYGHGLQLIYSAGGESIAELVPFAYTATAFGGQRKWFQCLSCRRRCRVLYGGKYFRCRKCYRSRDRMFVFCPS
jgi:hypothetical protein